MTAEDEIELLAELGALLLGGLTALMRYALAPVPHRLAQSPELLVLAASGWRPAATCSASRKRAAAC